MLAFQFNTKYTFCQTAEMTTFDHRAEIMLEWINNDLTLTLQITISVSSTN